MDLTTILFLVLAFLIVTFSAAVVILPNPIYAALSLAITMISLGFMYFLLQAYFIAGVQLIVYAGAVMVLFVMVLMLFDLRKEIAAFSGSKLSTLFKVLCGLFFAGAIVLAVRQGVIALNVSPGEPTPAEQIEMVKTLALRLFTQYVLAFEALGILLLVVAVGVVAVARSRGGTHAHHN